MLVKSLTFALMARVASATNDTTTAAASTSSDTTTASSSSTNSDTTTASSSSTTNTDTTTGSTAAVAVAVLDTVNAGVKQEFSMTDSDLTTNDQLAFHGNVALIAATHLVKSKFTGVFAGSEKFCAVSGTTCSIPDGSGCFCRHTLANSDYTVTGKATTACTIANGLISSCTQTRRLEESAEPRRLATASVVVDDSLTVMMASSLTTVNRDAVNILTAAISAAEVKATRDTVTTAFTNNALAGLGMPATSAGTATSTVTTGFGLSAGVAAAAAVATNASASVTTSVSSGTVTTGGGAAATTSGAQGVALSAGALLFSAALMF